MILTLVLGARAMGGGKLPVRYGFIRSRWIIQQNAIFDCNVVDHTASLDNVANLKRVLHTSCSCGLSPRIDVLICCCFRAASVKTCGAAEALDQRGHPSGRPGSEGSEDTLLVGLGQRGQRTSFW
jgi:hypothetical protein